MRPADPELLPDRYWQLATNDTGAGYTVTLVRWARVHRTSQWATNWIVVIAGFGPLPDLKGADKGGREAV